MKLTKTYLQQIIREEINTMLNEIHLPHGAYPTHEEWGATAGLPGSPGGFEPRADAERPRGYEPEVASAASTAALKREIDAMDEHWLVEEFGRNCSSESTDLWCQIARERIRDELGPIRD